MSKRTTVVLTACRADLQTIDLMKLLRRFGGVDLREAKRRVESLVDGEMVAVQVLVEDEAELVRLAREAGAIIDRSS